MFASKGERVRERSIAAASSINLIGEGTKIKGDMNSSGDVRIDGYVKGTIKTQAKLVIGPNGTVEGDIICNHADISGKVTGSLTVKELLFLKSPASIDGDIIATKLVVEAGALFNGTCRMGLTKDIGSEKDVLTKLEKKLI